MVFKLMKSLCNADNLCKVSHITASTLAVHVKQKDKNQAPWKPTTVPGFWGEKNEHVRLKACLSEEQPAKGADDRTQVLIRADRKPAN